MDRQSVVVPSATPASSLAFHRSLGRRGIRTIAVSEDDTVPSFRSRYCDENVLVPPPDEDVAAYKDALISLAMRPDVRTIVPLREPDIYVLSKYRSEFGEHVATPWPSFDTLRTAHDRAELFDAAREADVAVPETQPLDEVDDWDRELVVKSRFALLAEEYVDESSFEGLGELGSTTFVKPDERPDVAAIRSEFDHTPQVQEFVRGTEYSFGVLYDDGEPVVTAQKRINRGVKYYCGPSVYHESVDIPELEAVGRRLLEQLDWNGPADVDIIRDEETGEFKLLEINPRFWATVSNEIHAGIDFPHYLWCMIQDDAEYPDPANEPSIASHYLTGELSYLMSVVSEDHPLCERPSPRSSAMEIAKSIVEDPRFDLLDVKDPLPFAHNLKNEVLDQV